MIFENQIIDTLEILEEIKSQVEANPILLYMKGSPDAPQCGFSSQASQLLMACGERFAFIADAQAVQRVICGHAALADGR